MNSTSSLRTATALIAAIFGVTALMIAQAEITPKQEIVKLERVVITAKRATPDMQIVQLPRVVIEGRRAADDAQLAQVCAAQVLC